jgi:hypothetical protein
VVHRGLGTRHDNRMDIPNIEQQSNRPDFEAPSGFEARPGETQRSLVMTLADDVNTIVTGVITGVASGVATAKVVTDHILNKGDQGQPPKE